MTLKEKLEVEIMDLPIVSEAIDDIAKNLEYILEDFSIGFLEFEVGLLTKQVNGCFYFYCDAEWKTTKELLEIYKKEKGLC